MDHSGRPKRLQRQVLLERNMYHAKHWTTKRLDLMKRSHLVAAFNRSAGLVSDCEYSRSDFLAGTGIFWK